MRKAFGFFAKSYSGLQKLADLEENISTDETNEHYPAGYEDFYGRGSWSSIMSVYAFK